MNINPLDHAFATLLEVAEKISVDQPVDPPSGEWNPEQILAHLSLVSAATISAVCSVGSGAVTTYDNRIAQNTWTINRVIGLLTGHRGLSTRIRLQGAALSAIVSGLTEAELATTLPTLLVSHDQLLVDDRVPLAGLIDGLVTTELPVHTEQLRALL